jgi:hypothetical protein
MSKRCSSKNRNGKSCGAWALVGADRCALHADPERAAQMGSKKGHGRSEAAISQPDAEIMKPPKTASDVRDSLARTMAQVHANQIEPRTANALAYLATSLLRAIEVSDVEKRLGELEATHRVQERAFLGSRADSKNRDEG